METTTNNEQSQILKTVESPVKQEIIRKIQNFKGRFTMDFSDEYLGSLSEEKLRHILFAAIAINYLKN